MTSAEDTENGLARIAKTGEAIAADGQPLALVESLSDDPEVTHRDDQRSLIGPPRALLPEDRARSSEAS